jgi:hypothetical protein
LLTYLPGERTEIEAITPCRNARKACRVLAVVGKREVGPEVGEKQENLVLLSK